MESFEKIAVLIGGAVLLFLFLPGLKERLKNTPKGSSSDWQLVVLLLGGVVLFVYLLIRMV